MSIKVYCKKCGFLLFETNDHYIMARNGTLVKLLIDKVFSRYGWICPRCMRKLNNEVEVRFKGEVVYKFKII